jgi:ribosomal protein S18 acetylase RimI-like enzyme
MSKGKSDDAKKAWLHVVHTNEGAYKLYDGLGFKKVYTYRYLKKE